MASTTKKKINIAIDGFSSCGKSTLARSLAEALNYVYVDSGAMYRAITLFALQHGFIDASGHLNVAELEKALELVIVGFKYNPESGRNEIYLNGEHVEREIRTLQVSNHVSPVANVPAVRHKLVKLQKRMAEAKGVVMDGRDIGTVVLPDAELKLFMVADNKVRARRRFNELTSLGVTTTFEEVLKNITARDDYDSAREHDPLRKAPDAIVIDNTHLSLEEQFEFALKHAKRCIDRNAQVLNG